LIVNQICGPGATHSCTAIVSGVGFWDVPHGQTGAARNYAELHPVTGIGFIAGRA
jgi:hypothetical protein